MFKPPSIITVAAAIALTPITAVVCGEDLFIVQESHREGESRFGFADKEGKVVISFKFEKAKDFSRGLAPVSVDGKRWHFIDQRGVRRFPLSNGNFFDFAEPFRGELSLIRRQGKYGFVGPDGQLRIDAGRYEGARSFSAGFAAVTRSGKWGYINTDGDEAIAPAYDYVGDFDGESNLAPVRKGDQWMFIDTDGRAKTVIGDFRFANKVFGGIAAVIPLGSKNPYLMKINGEPSVQLPNGVDAVLSYSEGLAACRVGEHWGFVNRDGIWAIKPRFLTVRPFRSGLAEVVEAESGNWVYINKEGKSVFGRLSSGQTLNATTVTLKSKPPGADVYLVPIFEYDESVERDIAKMMLYLVAEGRTNRTVIRPDIVYVGVFVLDDERRRVPVDVIQGHENAVEVNFD